MEKKDKNHGKNKSDLNFDLSDTEFRKKIRCLCVDKTHKFDSNQNPNNCTIGGDYGKSFEESEVDIVRQMITDEKELNPCNEIYGYQLSLNYLQDFCKQIEDYNKSNPADQIGGIRLYQAISTRKIDQEMRTKADLVMVAFLEKTEEDVFRVDQKKLFGTDVKMYANFRPCPKMCGSVSFIG